MIVERVVKIEMSGARKRCVVEKDSFTKRKLTFSQKSFNGDKKQHSIIVTEFLRSIVDGFTETRNVISRCHLEVQLVEDRPLEKKYGSRNIRDSNKYGSFFTKREKSINSQS